MGLETIPCAWNNTTAIFSCHSLEFPQYYHESCKCTMTNKHNITHIIFMKCSILLLFPLSYYLTQISHVLHTYYVHYCIMYSLPYITEIFIYLFCRWYPVHVHPSHPCPSKAVPSPCQPVPSIRQCSTGAWSICWNHKWRGRTADQGPV